MQEDQRTKANSQIHKKIKHNNIPQTWQMMILSCYMFVFHQVKKKLKSAILMGTALIRQLSLDFDV